MTVELERVGDGCVVRLARPERANALDNGLCDELRRAVGEARRTGRFVVLTGSGGFFSAGVDRDEFGRLFAERTGLRRRIWRFESLVAWLRSSPIPLVSFADGAVVGGGCGLFWAGHLALAGPRFTLRLAFARLGLFPDMGTSAFGPARLGRIPFRRLYLRDPTIGPEEASSWGVTDNWLAPLPVGGAPQSWCDLEGALARTEHLTSSYRPTAGRLAQRRPGPLRLWAALGRETFEVARLGRHVRPEELVAPGRSPAGSAQ